MNNDIFAVFVETSTYIEGDERSRTHPGHGYGAYTKTSTEVIEFKTEAEFLSWVKNAESSVYSKPKYRAFRCTPLKVRTTLSVDVLYEK